MYKKQHKSVGDTYNACANDYPINECLNKSADANLFSHDALVLLLCSQQLIDRSVCYPFESAGYTAPESCNDSMSILK